MLAVNEIFGPTIQGEGKNLGMPCAFLRLAGCNLKCLWCDTKYTWDWTQYNPRDEIHPMTVEAVRAQLTALPVRNLVISGGEPMLQQPELSVLTEQLHRAGWWTEIETAGTIAPVSAELVNQFTVSPKLASSGNGRERYNPAALDALVNTGRAIFKFVVCSLDDFDEIDPLVTRHKMQRVYVMPEGVDASRLNEKTQEFVTAAVARGYWIASRLHIQLYGQRRKI